MHQGTRYEIHDFIRGPNKGLPKLEMHQGGECGASGGCLVLNGAFFQSLRVDLERIGAATASVVLRLVRSVVPGSFLSFLERFACKGADGNDSKYEQASLLVWGRCENGLRNGKAEIQRGYTRNYYAKCFFVDQRMFRKRQPWRFSASPRGSYRAALPQCSCSALPQCSGLCPTTLISTATRCAVCTATEHLQTLQATFAHRQLSPPRANHASPPK